MSRLTVLQALQTILETQFDRVYVYPDDLTTSFPIEPALPFLSIEEIPAADNATRIKAADWIDVDWFVSIFGFVYKGVVAMNTPEDVAAKALAYPQRDKVKALLNANTTLGGTTSPIGRDDIAYNEDITPVPWAGVGYYGFFFSIPVTSG